MCVFECGSACDAPDESYLLSISHNTQRGRRGDGEDMGMTVFVHVFVSQCSFPLASGYCKTG